MAGMVKRTHFWYFFPKVSLQNATDFVPHTILPHNCSKATHLLEVTNVGPAAQQEEK